MTTAFLHLHIFPPEEKTEDIDVQRHSRLQHTFALMIVHGWVWYLVHSIHTSYKETD